MALTAQQCPKHVEPRTSAALALKPSASFHVVCAEGVKVWMKTNVIRRSNTRSDDFNDVKFEGLQTNVLCQQQSIEVRRII